MAELTRFNTDMPIPLTDPETTPKRPRKRAKKLIADPAYPSPEVL